MIDIPKWHRAKITAIHEIPATEWHLYSLLDALADGTEDRVICPTLEELARALGVDKVTVVRRLATLSSRTFQGLQLIEKIKATPTSNVFYKVLDVRTINVPAIDFRVRRGRRIFGNHKFICEEPSPITRSQAFLVFWCEVYKKHYNTIYIYNDIALELQYAKILVMTFRNENLSGIVTNVLYNYKREWAKSRDDRPTLKAMTLWLASAAEKNWLAEEAKKGNIEAGIKNKPLELRLRQKRRKREKRMRED